MKSTCRDQARKSKKKFVFLHFCNFQQKNWKLCKSRNPIALVQTNDRIHIRSISCVFLTGEPCKDRLIFTAIPCRECWPIFFTIFILYLYLCLYLYLYLYLTKTKTKTKTMSKRHTLGISKWLPSTKDNITFKIRGRIHIRSKWCVFCNRWTAWF